MSEELKTERALTETLEKDVGDLLEENMRLEEQLDALKAICRDYLEREKDANVQYFDFGCSDPLGSKKLFELGILRDKLRAITEG